ncbi:MAG: TlpA family protein disulfide reductase [Proteobacteria bacterium]|nr:TlpA family protein disulfide reductase [Pseudomonadota bacterium]
MTAGGPSRRGSLPVLVAVVGVAAAIGFLAHRLLPARGGLQAAAPAATQGPHAPTTPLAPAAGRKVPDEVPDIVLPDLDGRPHHLAEYRGKLLVINFWATWCDPCRREIPLLKSLRVEFAKDGLEIVGIAVDSGVEVAKYAQVHGMTYPLLVGEQGGLEAATAFGMDLVLPFSVFADRAGHVVALKVGELRPEEAHAILSGLRDLDQGHLTLAAAQARIAGQVAALNGRRAAPSPEH